MVKVESDTGRGALFKLYLPRIELSELPVTEKAESLTDLNGTGTVLLAEDEERVRILLAGLLEKAGYSVIQAPNGEEALKMFSAAEPRVDLVVLDMVMPGMGGREVVEKLHEKEPDLPIILCTGYPGQELSQEFLEKHSLSLIRKPFMPVDLLRTLRDVSS
ncbi:MAG: response regulator [Deltaproteobacteria bacterium]|nr:response regulator [Deltaproteobacteria bacterium]